MSVNLWIHVTVTRFQPEREAAICAALDEVMKEFEGGWDIGEAASHVVTRGDATVVEIRCDTGMPVIISGASRWVPKFTAEVRAAVERANGRDCAVDVRIDDDDMLRVEGRPVFRLPPQLASH